MSQIQSLIQMWKLVHVGKPEVLSEKIVVEEDHHLTTRAPRLMHTEASFLTRTVKLWNSVPIETREKRNLITFKKHIKTWILTNRDLEPD